MRRREFLGIVAGAAALWPMTAPAQSPRRIYRISYLAGQPQSQRRGPYLVALLDESRFAGFNALVSSTGIGAFGPVARLETNCPCADRRPD
jgi:hypothetical protein